jgi:cell division septation protein DedD
MPMRDEFDREILDIIPERFDADADSRMAKRNARTRLLVTVSLAVLAVMALGVAARHILFGEAPRDRQLSVPVIHAEDKPVKVKPQDRGGMEVPNQDKLIYDQMASKTPPSQPERLLPPPEQAQVPPPAEQRPPPVEAKPAPAASEATPPKAMTAAAPPPPPAPSPVKPTTAAPAPAPAAAKPAPSPAPAAAKGGGWVVQLGAVQSEAQAKAEWARLKSAHKEQLADLSPDIVRVDLGAKGIFWRVRGGPLDEAQARLLCAELTKQSQGCIIARK